MRDTTLNLVHDILTSARQKGVIQLTTEDESYNGREITVNGNKLVNFGSCSYLGLEIDQRLKNGAIDAINRYGIQFSSSRAYMSCTLYTEFEQLLEKIFEAPILVTTSTSLGHHAVIPVVVGDKDAVIMDQQAHSSVQDASIKMKSKGVPVTIVRHNALDELKEKIEELYSSHDKIWYMLDGVYSMYGDYAPIEELMELLNKYKKLHLYIDDAHGMAWCGKHGRGYVLSQTELHPRMIVASSLAKAFGCGGGVFIFPSEAIRSKVKNCGGAFVFSGPNQIPVIGAAIASAKILLSEEIYEKQKLLAERIEYCQFLLNKMNLPVISNPSTPIFFVGAGLNRVGQNIIHKMIQDGFFLNLSVFPSVPETCTGIRFTITVHHTFNDIRKMVYALAQHFYSTLEEEGRNMNDVYRAFRRVKNFEETIKETDLSALETSVHYPHSYTMEKYHSINEISAKEWDSLMGDKGIISADNMKQLEEIFHNNPKPENNWDFTYYIIRDKNNVPVLATFFTLSINKDDMLSPAKISMAIERKRERNPYYLTSLAYVMGTLITEGQHLYIDREREDWKIIMMMLLDQVWKDQDEKNAGMLMIRDFDANDAELKSFFEAQGFLSSHLPVSLQIEDESLPVLEGFMHNLSSDKRYFVRKRAIEMENHYETVIVENPTEKQLQRYYELYNNIANKSFDVNCFKIPEKVFETMIRSNDWEYIEIRIKPEFSVSGESEIVGMALNYRAAGTYHFVLTGMDYQYLENYQVYSQILWQIVKRASALGYTRISLGLTATQNKRKFGAESESRIAYVQIKDHFNMNLIEMISSEESVHIS